MHKRTAFSSWKPQRRLQQMSKTSSTKSVSHSYTQETKFQTKCLCFTTKFLLLFLAQTTTAKRLPRVQPAENPTGMVLPNGPGATAASASCCA